MSAPRKLAAILAADVAGYSRLTDLDEEGTLKRLRRLRREHDQPGRGAPSRPDRQDPGDGVLIEFPSVVDAVRCALDARRGMASWGARSNDPTPVVEIGECRRPRPLALQPT